jgi:hypothetical protein
LIIFRIGKLDPLVDLSLLHGRKQQAHGRQARGILGAHRRLHVFVDLLPEAQYGLAWN